MSRRVSSRCRPLLVLFIGLILVSAHVAVAQNTNNTNANTNTGNVNTGTTNTNSAVNSNTNTNTNQNTNDTKAGADEKAAKQTASPDFREKLVDSTWYRGIVSAVFLLLILGFAGTIARVILRSKSSFRSPLGLPEGSLRAMLAFLLVAFLGFYVYGSVLSLSMDFKIPDALLGIIATVIGFYFGSRSVEAAGTGAKTQTGSVEGAVSDASGSPAAGATVTLSQGTNKKFTQTADLNGKYDFDNVPIGDYEVQASLTGHNPSDSAKVKVTAAGTQTVNLKLK